MLTKSFRLLDIKDLENTLSSFDALNSSFDTFVQIFLSYKDRKIATKIAQTIKTHFPNSVILGITASAGIMGENIYENTIISITNFKSTKIKIIKSPTNTSPALLGDEMGKNISSLDLKLVFAFSCDTFFNGDSFLNSLQKHIKTAGLVGGYASLGTSSTPPFMFDENEIFYNQICLVGLYSTSLKVQIEKSFDWIPIGKTFTVQETKDNYITKIDGIKPAKLYEKYLGKEFSKHFPSSSILFPLIFKKDDMDIGRVAVGVNNDEYMFQTHIEPNTKVQFGIGHHQKMIENAQEICDNVKKSYDNIFVYSCVMRREFFVGNSIEQEIKCFNDLAPVSGFFTFGEFFKKPNLNAYFFNETMIALMMSEEDVERKTPPKKHAKKDNIYVIESFSHLLNQVAKENETINKQLSQTVKQQTKELQDSNEKLLKELRTDYLTQLGNRNYLMKTIESKQTNWLMLIDLKNFNTINDLYGDKVGDLFLINFAKFLKQKTSLNAYAYRLYADRFALLCTTDNEPLAPKILATDLIRTMQTSSIFVDLEDERLEFHTLINIGYSENENKELLSKEADMALKYAKKNHINFVKYSSNLNIEKVYKNDILVVSKVKQAILEDNIVPYFQPIFTQDKIYYECLVRLIEPDGKVLSPALFLDVIKSTAHYQELTKIMIKKSFLKFSDIDTSFSVNFSYIDFQNQQTREFLVEQIKRYKVEKKLIVEILETEDIQNKQMLEIFLMSLRQMGVRIAVDDFDSGYSNIVHLVDLAPEFVKIDGSLIKNIDHDIAAQKIVKYTLDLANAIGAGVVAEYVHSSFVYETLKHLGINSFQGYFLGAPKDELLSPNSSTSSIRINPA